MTWCYLNDVVLTRKLLSAKENTKANFFMPTDCKLQRSACFQRCNQCERSKQYHAVTYSKNSGKKKVRMFFNIEDQQCFISIPFHMDMCENFKQNKRKCWCNSYREEPTLLENHQAPKPFVPFLKKGTCTKEALQCIWKCILTVLSSSSAVVYKKRKYHVPREIVSLRQEIIMEAFFLEINNHRRTLVNPCLFS